MIDHCNDTVSKFDVFHLRDTYNILNAIFLGPRNFCSMDVLSIGITCACIFSAVLQFLLGLHNHVVFFFSYQFVPRCVIFALCLPLCFLPGEFNFFRVLSVFCLLSNITLSFQFRPVHGNFQSFLLFSMYCCFGEGCFVFN